MTKIMTAEDIKKEMEEIGQQWYEYKFVRVGDEYRFCDIVAGNHKDLVLDETPSSAGFVYLYEKGKKGYPHGSSMILRMGWDKIDQERLPALLGFELDWGE